MIRSTLAMPWVRPPSSSGVIARTVAARGLLGGDELLGRAGDRPDRQGRVRLVDLEPGAGAFADLGGDRLVGVGADLGDGLLHHRGERPRRHHVPRPDRHGAVQHLRRQAPPAPLRSTTRAWSSVSPVHSSATVVARARSRRPSASACTIRGIDPHNHVRGGDPDPRPVQRQPGDPGHLTHRGVVQVGLGERGRPQHGLPHPGTEQVLVLAADLPPGHPHQPQVVRVVRAPQQRPGPQTADEERHPPVGVHT